MALLSCFVPAWLPASRFMPGSSNTQVATCSADRQVRMIDLDRSAAMPFVSHRSRVKALEVMSASCIISGGEGGRQIPEMSIIKLENEL